MLFWTQTYFSRELRKGTQKKRSRRVIESKRGRDRERERERENGRGRGRREDRERETEREKRKRGQRYKYRDLAEEREAQGDTHGNTPTKEEQR
jgi:RNA-binding protein 25